MKKIVTITSTILLLLLFALFCVYLDLIIYADKPAGTDPVKKIFIVARGQSFLATSERLYNNALIQHPFKFRLLARLKGFEKRIQAGEYLLSSRMSPTQVLGIMVEGKVTLHRVTIPEGSNIDQIASIMSEAGFGTREGFIRVASDPVFVREKDIDADTFEGYLFPDTYYFPRDETPRKIVSKMADRFWSAFKPEWKARCRELKFTIHEVVTLASIIEKETGAAFERPIISSVFHNRLKKGMRLESDPTVIYGIKNFDGDLKRRHLTAKTPYNTYKIKGLPPGPIANPGTASLEAALYPVETDYLFFVSKRDATHKFSTNLEDHNKAIRKYQLRR